jgi:hypothetical protein
LLVSVSPAREAHVFRLEQVPELYDVRVISHFVSTSSVVSLIEATPGNKQTKQTLVMSNDGRVEQTEQIRNTSGHHFYVAIFDRDGKYEKSIQIEDSFHIQQLGMFPSGTLIAYGFDSLDKPPKMILLKADGTLLRYLEVPGGGLAATAATGPSGTGIGIVVRAAQFAASGPSILAVPGGSGSPVLEISESGAVRAIYPKLPTDVQTNWVVPSDQGLYLRASGAEKGSIYEVSLQDGTILRRIQLPGDADADEVACVHQGKFLSFEHGEGRLIPLIGTASPVADASAERR